MRPSDEHQHRSKRPNLFSSSRGKAGADDNILARLERMPSEAAATQGPRTRIVMLGGAVLLIAGLIGTLATLTRDNVKPPRPMQVSVPPLAASKPAPTPLDDVRATILDEAPADQAAAGAPFPASAPVAQAHPQTAPQAQPDQRAAQPVTASEPIAANQAYRPNRPAAPTAQFPGKPQAVAPKAPPASAQRRPTSTTADDPDVAILTAILSQAPRHASGKNAEPECGDTRGKPCPSQF